MKVRGDTVVRSKSPWNGGMDLVLECHFEIKTFNISTLFTSIKSGYEPCIILRFALVYLKEIPGRTSFDVEVGDSLDFRTWETFVLVSTTVPVAEANINIIQMITAY